MDLDGLTRLLKPVYDGDVTALYDKFRRDTGLDDANAFYRYLHERDYIDNVTFCELHTLDDIDVASDPYDTPEDGVAQPQGAQQVREPSGRYDLLGEVGAGAMGTIHVARDLDLRRKVAFKTMRSRGAGTIQERRFLHEVQITAQLDHPNIVPVYSLDVASDGQPAYAMKLIQGVTLRRLLDEAAHQLARFGRVDADHSLSERLEHFLKVLDAMEYAHSKGVLHRDLKPDNIMIGRYHEVYVMDWGIARLYRDPTTDERFDDSIDLEGTGSSTRTRIGAVLGTPSYMSPEQAMGSVHELGPGSDQFALGLILYEVALLRPAYPPDAVENVLARAVRGEKVPPTAAAEAVPPELLAIIDKATAYEPTARYPSLEHMADDIRACLRDEPVTALPDTPLRAMRRWAAKHQQATILGVAGLLTAGALLFLGTKWQEQVHLGQVRAEAEVHRQVLSDLLARTTSRAQRIDTHFLWYEGRLEGIAAAAVQAILHGEPVSGPTWRTSAYRAPETSPPGMLWSPHYQRPVSTTWPVWTVAPGVAEATWGPDLGRLDALRPLLREVAMARPGDRAIPADPVAQAGRIAGDDVQLEWAYVATERSGLMYMFPGAAGWDDVYDPRTRPWYRDAVGVQGAVWGTPYVDLMGQGRLISCVKALYDDAGDLLGVAGVDLEFNFILKQFLGLDPGDVETMLVQPDRKIIVRSSAADAAFEKPPTERLDEGLDYGTFDDPAVVALWGDRPTGYVQHDGKVVAWSRLEHLGWTHVVVADPATLLP